MSNRDRFSLEIMLDDFTSGFWITHADMAGDCEEVVVVGGGIGTGARTGVEINKKATRTRLLIIMGGRAEPLKANRGRARPLESKQTLFG